MKYNLEEAVKWQAQEVDKEFSCGDNIEELGQFLKSGGDEDYTEHEIKEDIEKEKDDLKQHIENHRTPISLDKCILPQMAKIRIKAYSKVNSFTDDWSELHSDFFLLGEVMQASGHINVISANTDKVFTMLHIEDFELVPPQEC